MDRTLRCLALWRPVIRPFKWNFLQCLVTTCIYIYNLYQTHKVVTGARCIQSNKIEEKINRTKSNTNHSIGFSNRTKSNIYFALSSIFEPVKPIEHNRTQSDSILSGLRLFISKSPRTNQGDGALYKMSAIQTNRSSVIECRLSMIVNCLVIERSMLFDWANFIVSLIMFDYRTQSNDWCSIGFDYRTFDWICCACKYQLIIFGPLTRVPALALGLPFLLMCTGPRRLRAETLKTSLTILGSDVDSKILMYCTVYCSYGWPSWTY